MSEQGTTKEEKLLIELRGWYTLKGADCFRQAAEEIQRLREDLRRTESAHAIVMAENKHYKQVAAQLVQPIETAPKDGKDFLGWECGEPGIYYRTEDTPDDAAISFGTAAYPTHWMPLPDGPSQPTGDG